MPKNITTILLFQGQNKTPVSPAAAGDTSYDPPTDMETDYSQLLDDSVTWDDQNQPIEGGEALGQMVGKPNPCLIHENWEHF